MKSIKALWGGVALCFVLVLYSIFFRGEKIAYVESSRIYQEYKGAKAEREKLEAHAEAL